METFFIVELSKNGQTEAFFGPYLDALHAFTLAFDRRDLLEAWVGLSNCDSVQVYEYLAYPIECVQTYSEMIRR